MNRTVVQIRNCQGILHETFGRRRAQLLKLNSFLHNLRYMSPLVFREERRDLTDVSQLNLTVRVPDYNATRSMLSAFKQEPHP